MNLSSYPHTWYGVILIHVNSADYPPDGLKCTPDSLALAATNTPPDIHAYKTFPKTDQYIYRNMVFSFSFTGLS